MQSQVYYENHGIFVLFFQPVRVQIAGLIWTVCRTLKLDHSN